MQRTGYAKYVLNGRQPEMEKGSDTSSVASISARGSQGSQTLHSKVAPEQQKQILGERLFALVENQKSNLASKITGMLLEMDNSELLLLLESSESLTAKLDEAVLVLKDSQATVYRQDALHNSFLSSGVTVN